jgi:redox-sensitive bicupin YhaK (pirin superfamily)
LKQNDGLENTLKPHDAEVEGLNYGLPAEREIGTVLAIRSGVVGFGRLGAGFEATGKCEYMMTIRKSEERGHANHGWLDSYHSFSFANYYDPRFMGFGPLRVINDDTVLGGGGFDTHPHRDMEIISYVLSGALEHRDSMGHSAVMKAGDVQRISAGAGILHSEFNHSPIEPVHFLQIWIMPDQKGVKPSYAEKSFADAPSGRLELIASKGGRDGSLTINQDADVYLAKLNAGETVTHSLKPTRSAWVQVAQGEVSVNGKSLTTGDGAAITEESSLSLSGQKAQVALFDLK